MATARTKRKNRSKSRFKLRASWRGQLRFGLVSFEVQALNAEIKERGEVHFHLLHAPDHERIHYAKMCPKHGEVPNEEIVEGYELSKGRYVEFDKEELDTFRTESEKALTIDAFVDYDEIDPIYFDGRMYFLMPSGSSAAEPYALLQTAMQRKQRWGVGQVVFSGREQLAIIRPLDGVLTMAMLNYEAEIRKPTDVKQEFSSSQTTPRKLRLAEQLIDQWHEGRFDFSQYRDRYQEKVRAAIEAKKQGREIEVPQEEEPEVINLIDALQRSVARTGRGASHRATRRAHAEPGSNGHRKKPHARHRKRA
jgi:DNA end-binding protein Ku